MKFKDKETRKKMRHVDIEDVEVMKPERIELSQVEYNVLLSIFNDARHEPDLTKYKITKVAMRARLVVPLPDHLITEDQELVLDIDIK